MGSVASDVTTAQNRYRPDYQQIASRFSDPRDCLAAHLMLECSETLAGVKPANLVSLVNRVRPCGKNLYSIWQQHQQGLSGSIDMLQFRLLQTTERAMLLFCHNPEQLDRHLAHPGIRNLLAKAGYDTALTTEELLDELACRIRSSSIFPHEIGLFIDYPAKDVAAFMGLVKLPFTCQGPWKIYGNPEQSLCLANAFRHSRQKMINHLSDCQSPLECIESLKISPRRFFGRQTDKSIHYQ